jgi:hypothetical protein
MEEVLPIDHTWPARLLFIQVEFLPLEYEVVLGGACKTLDRIHL